MVIESEEGGSSGSCIDALEEQASIEFSESGFDEVVIADGSPSDGDDEVGSFEGVCEGIDEEFFVVDEGREGEDLAAEEVDEGGESKGVGGIYLPLFEGFPRKDEFGTCGYEGDARRFADGNLFIAEGCGKGDIASRNSASL